MDILDVILLMLVGLLAFVGYRRGLTWGGLSTAGLIAGSILGALIAPPITRFLTPHTTTPGGTTSHPNQPLVTAGIFLACVLLVQGIGTAIGFRVRTAALRTRFSKWDSVAGSIAGGFGVLITAWFLGFILAGSSFAWVSDQVRGSAIERVLGAVAPNPPPVLAGIEQYLRNNSDLPNPFAGINQGELPPQQIPTSVDTPGVASATKLVAKVISYSAACGGADAGSAWPVGNDYMVTNAHVVARSDRIEVDMPDGTILPAKLVHFNPEVDIAILYVPGAHLAALPITNDVPAAGTSGAVIGYPEGGAENTSPAAVRGAENAYGYNIYNDGYVTRNIIVVSANVIPGDSGGPLVNLNGQVIGLVFASSTVHPGVEGYALSVPQIMPDIVAGKGQTQPVGSGEKCVGGG